MSQSQLTAVLRGQHGLGPKAVIRIAEILQLDVGDVLILIEEDKARTDDDKQFWGRRSPRVSAALATAGLALIAAVNWTSAKASTVIISSSNATSYTLYELGL
jgi:hypothetical protein